MPNAAKERSATLPLRVRGLTKAYRPKGAVWQRCDSVLAVDDVNFEISPGKTFALVGRSGSGKSTVARCVVCLERADAGEIWLGGANIVTLSGKALTPFRSKVQIVFQDPSTAMNPRMSAREIVEEPLLIQRLGSARERSERVAKLMAEVRVSPDTMDRPIHQFSGGQQQRLAIARALAVQPQILVLDEALSGLDLSTQAQIANLLIDLQQAHGLSYLLISHDLGLVVRLADEVAVLSGGRIVERFIARELFARAAHPETRALLAAAPSLRPIAKGKGAAG